MAMVLLYAPQSGAQETALRMLLLRLRVKVKTVLPEEVGQTVGCLAGLKDYDRREAPETPEIRDTVLVFCDFAGNQLDELLRGMKKAKISLPYKAMLTPTNAQWPLYRLHEELQREHEAFQARLNSKG